MKRSQCTALGIVLNILLSDFACGDLGTKNLVRKQLQKFKEVAIAADGDIAAQASADKAVTHEPIAHQDHYSFADKASGNASLTSRRRNIRRRRGRGAVDLSRRRYAERAYGAGEIFSFACRYCKHKVSGFDIAGCSTVAESMWKSCPATLNTEIRRRAAEQGRCFHPGLSGDHSISLRGHSMGRRRSQIMVDNLCPCVTSLMGACQDASCVLSIVSDGNQCPGVCPVFRSQLQEVDCPVGALLSKNMTRRKPTLLEESSEGLAKWRTRHQSKKGSTGKLDDALTGKCTG